MIGLLISFILISLVLFYICLKLPVNSKTEFYMPIISLGFYSASLMINGYFAGMMTIVTGVFTIGSIFTGMLLFSPRIMWYGSIPCLIVFYLTSILTVLKIIPYAAAYQPYTFVSQHMEGFVVLFNLVLTTLIGVALVSLFSAFLQRWTAREQTQKRQIFLDPLTQTFNRRGVEHYFQQMASSHPSTYCLALLDIDYFKKINDEYGHDCGDQVIIRLTEILKLNIRKKDYIARMGGEEFLIIFEETPIDLAYQILERCQNSIETYILEYEEKKIQFTASFGISMAQDQQDYQSVLKHADNALYEAKRTGRNRICMV
ncbi:GGDEF domain-containing protein [Acinetobacter sp. 194]|uniref:GGDEF domain-containing protein n=1 Tax=Acinetobacter shaoyimingii TaxID=2715164 RepID=UPI00140C7A87|nr:GGDEF domain-containing protein [Acinetobacter shaoyimingii]NHB59533.1 GGDEF domain-containing protein [Acinetobacter shaoyimingii]